MAMGGGRRGLALGAAVVAGLCAGATLAEPASPAIRPEVRSVPNPTQVLVVGDSFGASLVPGIGRAGIRVVDGTSRGCRLVRGRIRHTSQVGKPCRWRTLWRRAVDELDPRVVVLASGVGDLFDVNPHSSDRWLVPGTPAWAKYYEATLRRAAKTLGATGARVVIPTIPYFYGTTAGTGSNPSSSSDPDRVRAANRVIERVARETSAPFTAPDLNEFLRQDAQRTGTATAFRGDGVRLNEAGSTAVGSWLAPTLTRQLGDLVRKDRRPGPVRVLLVGDSITVNYESSAAAMLSRKGYRVIGVGLARSSLLDTGICDGSYARALLEFEDPDVVVFENIGNYDLQPGIAPCTPRVEPGSKRFYRQWRAAARLNQTILTSRQAEFLWVLGPSVSPLEAKRSRVANINTIYRKLAGKRHGLVDGWNALGGARFDPTLRYDLQHLNAAGSRIMAEHIKNAVR